MKAQHGFTMLELLVSIAIIAVLLAITLPSLVGASTRAAEVKLLANQQESMRLLLAYANDHQGFVPHFGIPQTQAATLMWEDDEVAFKWWDQSHYWGVYLQSKGYEGWVSMGEKATPEVYDQFDCIGCGQAFSRHVLTATAFADPPLFQDDFQDEIKRHHPQRVDATAHPSGKIALTLWSVIRGQRTIAHFFDGSGGAVVPAKLRPGVDPAFIGIQPLPGMLTRDGLRGRDRR